MAAAGEILGRIDEADRVLVVAQATHLDEDLRDLLPLARGKRGLVAVTFRDKLPDKKSVENFCSGAARAAGVLFVPVDARAVTEAEKARIFDALENPPAFDPCASPLSSTT